MKVKWLKDYIALRMLDSMDIYALTHPKKRRQGA